MRYFLEQKDTEFSTFALGFKNQLINFADALNFDADEITELESAVSEYVNNLKKQRQAKTEYSSSTISKKNSKSKAQKLIAKYANRLRANDDVSNDVLVSFGLPVHDEILSESKEPDGAPLLQVGITHHCIHKIEIRNRQNLSRGKPKTAVGAEVWVFVGDKKDLSEKNLRYLGTATRSKFEAEHDTEDAGKTAHYMARWINRRGIRGEWSATVSATIAE